jgi:acetyl-CoA carboxylase alpha subunit
MREKIAEQNEMIDISNADHPDRIKARQIIEQVIEPFIKKEINGEDYYRLEDDITALINYYG